MARGFNKAIIIGNLARDPEIRYTNSGMAVAKMAVAVNRTWMRDGQKQEEVDFIPVVVWDKQAESCDKYLRKGSALLVEGRISVRSYEGRDGQKKYATEIVAQGVQFLGSKSDGNAPVREDTPPDSNALRNASRNGYVENSNAARNDPGPPEELYPTGDGDEDEDIPF